MVFPWRLLANYMRATTQFELTGITPEELQNLLREEGRQRLLFVESIIFDEEMTSEEKVKTLTEWFRQP